MDCPHCKKEIDDALLSRHFAAKGGRAKKSFSQAEIKRRRKRMKEARAKLADRRAAAKSKKYWARYRYNFSVHNSGHIIDIHCGYTSEAGLSPAIACTSESTRKDIAAKVVSHYLTEAQIVTLSAVMSNREDCIVHPDGEVTRL